MNILIEYDPGNMLILEPVTFAFHVQLVPELERAYPRTVTVRGLIMAPSSVLYVAEKARAKSINLNNGRYAKTLSWFMSF